MTASAHTRIPHGCLVLVGDGRKATVLRNQGEERDPDLRVTRILRAAPNPRTHEQGSDRPGSTMTRGRRSRMEQPDWHQIAEDRFADQIAADLTAEYRANPFDALIIVAPPRALAELRRSLPEEVRCVVRGEIDKDFTKHPVHEIAEHLTGS